MRIQLALNVRNLDEAIEYYSKAFDTPVHKRTLVGRIEAMDVERRSLTVAGPQGRREIAVSDATTIWLDRTALGLTNTPGTLADCQAQRSVEIKLDDDGRGADWIKGRMSTAPAP